MRWQDLAGWLSGLLTLFGASVAAALSPGEVVVDYDRSRIVDTWRGGLLAEFHLTDAVPYAVGVAAAPDHLVLRFEGVVVPDGAPQATDRARRAGPPAVVPRGLATELRVPLEAPMLLSSAEITWAPEGPRLRLLMAPAEIDAFAAEAARWQAWHSRLEPPTIAVATPGPLHVMLDPGHGGIDPGAQHGGVRESDLVLTMAETLAARLRAEGARVSLTRTDDSFVSLPERVARANRAGADVFISLHADAVQVGSASGASVHTLPERAMAAADRFLLHELGTAAMASDPPADAATTRALMQVARRHSAAAAEALADELVRSLEAEGLPLYKRPRKRSNFVVLRAADMPSVLVELGFLSEPADRDRLVDPAWRAQMADALVAGLMTWAALR